jgi:Prp8 binding protein
MPVNAQKRPGDNLSLVAVQQTAKRSRNDELLPTFKDKQLLEKGVNRTTNLFAPIMKLEGHESEIFSCEFHPEGELLGKKLIPLHNCEYFIFFPIFMLFQL